MQPNTEARALRSTACTCSCREEEGAPPTSSLLDSLLEEEVEGGKLDDVTVKDGADDSIVVTSHSSCRVCDTGRKGSTKLESKYTERERWNEMYWWREP